MPVLGTKYPYLKGFPRWYKKFIPSFIPLNISLIPSILLIPTGLVRAMLGLLITELMDFLTACTAAATIATPVIIALQWFCYSRKDLARIQILATRSNNSKRIKIHIRFRGGQTETIFKTISVKNCLIADYTAQPKPFVKELPVFLPIPPEDFFPDNSGSSSTKRPVALTYNIWAEEKKPLESLKVSLSYRFFWIFKLRISSECLIRKS